MALFSSPQSYLGVDVDSNSIKIVELKNEGGRPLPVRDTVVVHPTNRILDNRPLAPFAMLPGLVAST